MTSCQCSDSFCKPRPRDYQHFRTRAIRRQAGSHSRIRRRWVVRVWELACGRQELSVFSFQFSAGRGAGVGAGVDRWRQLPVAVVSAGSPASRLPQPISGFAARFGCGSLLASEQRIRFSVFSFQQALGHRLLPVVVGGDGFT
jgi:hypothetical protein